MFTLLALQSRFGDTILKFQVVSSQKGIAVLKGLTVFDSHHTAVAVILADIKYDSTNKTTK